jgi:glycosyltransferase involved in cell wall biosynthesis
MVQPLSARAPGLPAVLQVVPALTDGGAQTSAIEMAAYVHAHGWGSAVASAGGPQAVVLEKLGIPHHTLPLASKNPLTILGNSLRLLRLTARGKINILHARSRAPGWSAWLAVKMWNTLAKVPGLGGPARFHPVAFVATYHGTYGAQGVLKKFYNSVMLRGRYVIANSQFITTHLMETYGIDPTHIAIAPRGVEPAVFDPATIAPATRAAILAECGAGPEVPLIVCVGRLTRWKGQALLLEALALLADVPWQLAIVGGASAKDAAYAAELHAQVARLGLTGRVVFLGSRTDIPALNATATLAVNMAIEPEAFGRAAIEAMAMGTPVVATALGGSRETITPGITGWLIDAAGKPDGKRYTFAPQVVAQTLRAALTNPKALTSMSQAARAQVLANYTVQACCAAEFAVYGRLLNPAQTGHLF